ncbi:MAG: hypothetical protein HKN72_07440 [Gemmatimonadetes bacterium]|nr:hypothetical protein [Gemmatimonadota bacterium]NNL30402.1 hypothetical protein [Gemmatimonadota bacterium]
MHYRLRRAGLPAMLLAVATSIAFATPSRAAAQDPTDTLRLEVERLAALVDSLSREVERLRAEGRDEEAGDALADLRAAAAAAAAAGGGANPASDVSEDQQFVGRQRSLQGLNPEISLNADVFGHLDPDDTDADNFFWREFELSIQSALDPYSRAAVFISRHGVGPEVVPFGGELGGHGHGHEGEEEGEEGGHEGEAEGHGGEGFEIEEGYVEWVSLPGGLGLKLGKFFQRLTNLNRWHAHALPFQSRSLPHLAFLGEESLAQSGVSVTWLAPFGGGGAGTYEATVEVTRSENEALFGEASSASVLTHLNAFWQLGNSVDFELGGAWLNGHFKDEDASFGRNLYSVEAAFNWIPPERSRRAGLTLRGGYMLLDGLANEEDPMLAGTGDASGLWTMAELRLNTDWLIGARFDRVESPLEPEETQWLFSPTLTWWQSEYVRIRAEYDTLSAFEEEPRTGMFVLQVTFGMGPHRHATY